MNALQEFFLKSILSKTSEPGERAKILLCFRFALVYLLLTVFAFPLSMIFRRIDILGFMLVLALINSAALVCLKVCAQYKNAAILIAISALLSALGHSLLSSLSMSIIIFIWPVIVAIFVSFILGRTATVLFILIFALTVIAVSTMRLLHCIPLNPLDETRILHSTLIMMILSSLFLFYFLNIYEQSRNEAIAVKLASLESKDNILHVVAHDLRNALGGSYGIIPMLRDSLAARNFDECLSYLDIIAQSTEAGLSIVNEILESATPFTDTKSITFVNHPVVPVINEIIQQYRPAAAKKRIAIVFNHHQQHCFFHINLSMIQRVFGNLLSNAIKFTPIGGSIEVSVTTGAAKILIVVKDNGIGIPPALLDKIFNKYTTAGRTGTDGERSIGLGMYSVKNLLTAHNAPISVQSQEHCGTTVSIEFPQAHEELRVES